MRLLGITGVKGSGKGTVAQYVAEWAAENGLLALDRGFADKLKWAMARIFWPDISREDAIKWAEEFKNDRYGKVAMETADLVPGVSVPRYSCITQITGRELFQHGGTEMGRNLFGENFWVDQLLPWDRASEGSVEFPLWCWSFLKEDASEPSKITIATISDLRFANEAQRISDLGGKIWKVDRKGFNPDGHASEVPLEDRFITEAVPNDGDLLDLKQETFDRCERMFR